MTMAADTIPATARLLFARWLYTTGRLHDGVPLQPEPGAAAPTPAALRATRPAPVPTLISPARQLADQAAHLLEWIEWVPRTVGQPDVAAGAWEYVLAAARDLAQRTAQHARGELPALPVDETPF